MKHINHLNKHFGHEVDVFTNNSTFRGIIKQIFPNPGDPHKDIVEVEPTGDFGKLFGNTIVEVSAITAVRFIKKD